MKKNNGITLVALVITIIVLLILSGVTIGILSNSNIFEKTEIAKEKTLIAQYKEQIELVRVETILEYGSEMTLNNLKNNFDKTSQKNWVNNTIKINDKGTEKIQLTTNDKYIFYVTVNTTEYKGKNDEVIEDKSVITISASPSSKTDDTISSIIIDVMIDNTENIISSTGYYAWNQSSSAEISSWEEFTINNNGDKKRTGKILSSQAMDGDYYLYVKSVINGKEEVKRFGIYKFQAKPTADNIVCEKITVSADETTLTLRVGSNKTFTGWSVTYKIVRGTDIIVNDTEITAGTTIENVTLTKGDVITVKYSKTGETAVTRTLNAEDYNLVLTAEMLEYTRTWEETSITNVKQALDYLSTKFTSN